MPVATVPRFRILHGLQVLQGLSGLGAVSAAVQQQALDVGVAPGDLATLIALGATDHDVLMLADGEIDFPSLMQLLTGGPPHAGVPPSQMQMEPTDFSGYGVEQALASLDSDLRQLETMVASSPAVASAVGGQVVAERGRYNSWASQYHSWVNATNNPQVLTMPDGTQQIVSVDQAGVNWVAIVSVSAVVALAAAIVAYHSSTVSATVAQARAAMVQAAQAAASAGDTQTAHQILDVAKQTGGGGSGGWLSFIETDWKWMVLGLVGLVVAGPVAEGLFGGRRRR